MLATHLIPLYSAGVTRGEGQNFILLGKTREEGFVFIKDLLMNQFFTYKLFSFNK